jgi:glutaredoxin
MTKRRGQAMTQQGTYRTPRVASSGASPLPIVMYGAAACEDTAITRSRLVAIGIPFRELDIDLDPQAARAQLVANEGRRATPTLVFGAGQLVVVEPTLERLGEALAAAGHAAEPPEAVAYQDEMASRPIPLRRLPTAGGEEFSLEDSHGLRQAALFLGHDAGCLACFGYAVQLAAQREALADVESIPVIVVAGTAGAAAAWRHGIAEDVPILADVDGSWKRAVAQRVGAGVEGTILLVLDRLASPRAGSIAAEAGGLVNPSVATDRLRHLARERPGGGTKEQPHG